MLRIISIGKPRDKVLQPAIERYEKRLKKPFQLEWIFLSHSPHSGTRAVEEESERIEKRFTSRDFIILLDVQGSELSTHGFAKRLESIFTEGKRPTFVIGGAYGVNTSIRQKAHFIWSLSPLVFPHQLVRLIVAEQLYRVQTIQTGGSYHHE